MRRRFFAIGKPNNIIIYTSSDGQLVVPNSDNFGAHILNNVMYGEKGLITFTGNVKEIGTYVFNNCTTLRSIVLPDSVVEIGSYAFAGCISLENVNIPYGVTSVGICAFYGCTSLTNITIPDSVTEIKASSFEDCSRLTSIIIPDSVTFIGAYSFRFCHSLSNLIIGNNVPDIGSYVFQNCSSLTSVTIGNSVTSIGEGAFYDCGSLTSVNIPDSVTSIGKQAFTWCVALTSITIPDGVTSIGDTAFYGCENLTSVYCKAIAPPTAGYEPFDGGYIPKIYVPYQSLDAYRSAENWAMYADYIFGCDFSKNYGTLKAGTNMSVYIEWAYPVASDIAVHTSIGSILTLAGDTVSIYSGTLGPGESIQNVVVDSISPSSDSQYSYHVLFPVTLESYSDYPEVTQYLMDKYGLNYGTKRSPLPIEETIILGGSYANNGVGAGKVKYISTGDTWNATISLKLYLEDHTSTYYCATLSTSQYSFGRAGMHFYD